MSAPLRWDIFCAVVDNYGDAGVTWRLARQLAAEHGIAVRLWIDDLRVLQRLWPTLAVDAEVQTAAGVSVRRWPQPLAEVEPADVVIEAFACDLPDSYRHVMAARPQPPLWLNLEYLSAEAWVADCHGLPSPQPHGLQKYFFFPGFSAATGGLPIESDLLQRRRRFQADPQARAQLFAGLGLNVPATARVLSLFAYENPALRALLGQLALASTPVWCLVPEGRALDQVQAFFGAADARPGMCFRQGALTVAVLPFLQQDTYDQLLWSCDINAVRGEDSFLRAQWAGHPLLWQIYPQEQGAHWPKLQAFLATYSAALAPEPAAALAACWRAWNGDGAIGPAWELLLQQLPALQQHAESWAEHWTGAAAQGENLAGRLVQFCANRV